MDSGDLRDVIDLQRPVIVRGGNFNDKQVTWVSIVRGGVRGRALDVAGTRPTEATVSGKRTGLRKREVKLRYLQPTPQLTWRLRVNAETYVDDKGDEHPLYWQLVGMSDLPGNREGYLLLCEEYQS